MTTNNPAPFTINVSGEELSKRSLFIAAPMYGGLCHGPFRAASIELTRLLTQWEVKHQFADVYHESLIPRGRNYLVDQFLRSECTHMIFLDADIAFNANDVLSLLAIDRDVIGAPYPKKSLDWENIRKAILKHPDIKAEDLERISAGFVFNLVEPGSLNIGQIAEVLEIGTGYMMVKRHVFEQFIRQYPEQMYTPDNRATKEFDGHRDIGAFFDCQIDHKRTVTSVIDGVTRECGGSKRYLSEDYFFCQWWRNMGGKIHLCPWMKSIHIGTYYFKGDLSAHAEFLGTA